MLIFDGHVDTLMRLADHRGLDLGNLTGGHVCLDRLTEAGVTAQIFAVFVPPQFRHGLALHYGLKMVEAFWRSVTAYPNRLGPILEATDLTHHHREGRIGCLLSLEGGEPLEGEISHLHTFYRLGLRGITLTWNHRNELGDGIGEANGAGLSDFGREVVCAMNSLGMLIDVSHLSVRGFWDVLAESQKPIIASHSNAKVLCDHRRNLDEQQIRALADAGGVIGVNFCPQFLTDTVRPAVIDDVVRHIDYLANTGGIDCVGLGSDFDGIGSTPVGLEDVSTIPRLVEKLEQYGYDSRRIEKVMGENLARVTTTVLATRSK